MSWSPTRTGTLPAEPGLPEGRPLRALGLILAASVCFAGLGATVKALAPRVGLAAPIAARGVIGLLVGLVWLRVVREPLRPRGWGSLTLRCTAGGAAMILFYWSLSSTGGGADLPTAVVLLKTNPLWVAVLAPLVVREAPGARTWVALAVGAVGVGLRYGVSLEGEQRGLLAALAAGFLSALAYLSLRRLARTDSPVVVVVWFSAFLALAAAPFLGDALTSGPWTVGTWALVILAGSLGTTGQLLLTAAYRWGTAAAVTVTGLAEVAFALVLSVVLFGEQPSAGAIVGGALALAAGVIAARPPAERAAAPTPDVAPELAPDSRT